MKFFFISTMEGTAWGASELLWSQTALRLAAAGHTVAASSLRSEAPVWKENMRKLEAGGVTVRPRAPQYSLKNIVADRFRARWKFLPRMDAELNELHADRPDLVLISEGANWPPMRFVKPCLDRAIPYALLLHAAGEHQWPSDETAADLHTIYTRARAAYFVSRANLEVTKLHAGVPGRHFRVVRNPVNMPYDTQVPMPSTANGYHLAFVGRLDPTQKGCDLLIRAMAAPEWRQRNVTVNFYGTGGSDQFVRRMASDLGLKNVLFHGHVNDIVKLWSKNHMLVLPSRSEGLPTAIIEAMLCGRPCIVTDIAGNAELLQEGVSGFIARAPTVDLLREAMERAWEARERWSDMGRAAADAVRKQVPPDPASIFTEELLRIASAPPDSTPGT